MALNERGSFCDAGYQSPARLLMLLTGKCWQLHSMITDAFNTFIPVVPINFMISFEQEILQKMLDGE